MALGGLLFGFGLLLGVVAWELSAGSIEPVAGVSQAPSQDSVERGAYLARAGNCMACHTSRGGQAFAGGREIQTPFGVLLTSNLTPDSQTGLGQWSEQAFVRAMHEGISRDGRLLYPAFPYNHMTRLTEADVRDLWAYLGSLAPIRQDVPAHRLRFPYNLQASLALWRLMNFQPGRQQADPGKSVSLNRGAYLIEGVAHCGACHTPRDGLGGARLDRRLGGAMMPDERWLAPSLLDPAEAGVQDWPTEDVVALLGGGQNHRAVAMGPMAEVVFHGAQYLTEADLKAMAAYLRALPRVQIDPPDFVPARGNLFADGKALYAKHCADCHGAQGQGAPGAYPSLAGNRTVTMASPVNLVQAIVSGGFAPSTQQQPRPYGMPPFRTLLSDGEIASLATFLRQSWGHRANPVMPHEVQEVR